MLESFKLTGNKIYIYGAAYMGGLFFNILKRLYIHPMGYIDKRGEEIKKYNGLSVMSMENMDEIPNDAVILIAVKNVFEHSSIADVLCKKGFSKIIYRPYAAIRGFGNKEDDLLNTVYENLLKGKESVLMQDIPCTKMINIINKENTTLIETMKNGNKIVYMPIELLYTEKKPKKGGDVNFWSDIPVLGLIGHIDFYRWANQEYGKSPDMYLEFCEYSARQNKGLSVTKAWRENVIRNRAEIFENMNESLQKDFNFFIVNSVNAKYDARGIFELNSGKNRVSFFIAKGRRYIPVNISEKDYEKWMGETLKDIVELCIEKGIVSAKGPLEFPYLCNIPSESGDGYYKILCSMFELISRKMYKIKRRIEYNDLNVLITADDDGYVSRCLRRCGVKVYENKVSVLHKIMDTMIENKYFPIQIDKTYDIALLDYKFDTDKIEKIITSECMQIKFIYLLMQDEDLDVYKTWKHNYKEVEMYNFMMHRKRERLILLENKNVVW